MRTLSKRDILFATTTGLTAGLIAWAVLAYLQKSLPLGFGPAWLVLMIPTLWLAGVQLGYFLGRWLPFFDQFGKYAAIGFTNFAVDAGVFNLLISLTQVTAGPGYAAQKTASFVIAVTHSYGWNRWWAFESQQTDRKKEFFKFLAINILALIVNVGISTLMISILHRPDTITPEVWANIGAVIGSACALIFSFLGLRLIVFK